MATEPTPRRTTLPDSVRDPAWLLEAARLQAAAADGRAQEAESALRQLRNEATQLYTRWQAAEQRATALEEDLATRTRQRDRWLQRAMAREARLHARRWWERPVRWLRRGR